MKYYKIIFFLLMNQSLMIFDSDAQVVSLKHTRNTTQYELSNHLGNVLATIGDGKKVGGNDATVLTTTDYYAFGMEIKERSYALDGAFRYGYNGKENDRDWGTGLIQDYGFRLYNPAVARFLSVDPLSSEYPWYTPYLFAGNKPINSIDVAGLGDEPKIIVQGYVLGTDLNFEKALNMINEEYRLEGKGGLGEFISNSLRKNITINFNPNITAPDGTIRNGQMDTNGNMLINSRNIGNASTERYIGIILHEISHTIDGVENDDVTHNDIANGCGTFNTLMSYFSKYPTFTGIYINNEIPVKRDGLISPDDYNTATRINQEMAGQSRLFGGDLTFNPPPFQVFSKSNGETYFNLPHLGFGFHYPIDGSIQTSTISPQPNYNPRPNSNGGENYKALGRNLINIETP